MRWGIREHASKENMTVEMCLSEIKNCQDSAGINFVLLSTQKCGYQPIPRRIDAAVLSEIMEIADSSEASCLNMYYCLDFNSLEPKYILQAGNLSQSEWSKRESELRGILQSCAKRAWPTLDIRDPTCNHPAKDFFISVTEMEICNGILGQGGRDDKCCVFILTITDLEDAVNAALLSNVAEEKKLVSNYIDMLQDRVDSEAQEKLMWGKTIMIPSVYKLDILNTSEVAWGPGVTAKAHHSYLEAFADRFCLLMMDSIKTQVLANERIEDHVYSKVETHTRLAINRANMFSETDWGRKFCTEVLSYIENSQSGTIIIQGSPGSGKTSLMAHLCKEITEHFGPSTPKSASVFTRFVGSTHSSSSARDLICSILEQIIRIHTIVKQKEITAGLGGESIESAPWTRAINVRSLEFPSDFGELAKAFQNALSQASSDYPLILLLDGLEQLCEDEEGAPASWLPTKLPANVLILLSTVGSKESIHTAIETLKYKIDDVLSVVQIEKMGKDDGAKMLESYLRRHGRCLSDTQKALLLENFQDNCTPRWLEIAAAHALKLKSYDTFHHLNSSVGVMLLESLDNFELMHGFQLVKFVSVYVALSRMGLSENELLQLLSLNDLVLADAYQWWVPPLRILPVMLLKRLLLDYQPYIKLHEKTGSSLQGFLDHSLQYAVLTKYDVDHESRTDYHFDLMHFFLGSWAGKSKPYQDVLKRKMEQFGLDESEGDRLVIPQPLILHSTAPFFSAITTSGSSNLQNCVNLRRLDELFYHCYRTGKIQVGQGLIVAAVNFGREGDDKISDAVSAASSVEGGGEYMRAVSEVCSLQYFFAKCTAGRLRDLMHELKLLSQATLDHEGKRMVSDYSRFLALHVHAFRGKPESILQQAYNLPGHMLPFIEAQKLLPLSSHCAILCPLQEKEATSSVICNLQHNRQRVSDVNFIQDTSYLVSLSSDSSVKLFDYQIGEEACEIPRIAGESPLFSVAAFLCRDHQGKPPESQSGVVQDLRPTNQDTVCIIGGREDGTLDKWSGPWSSMTKRSSRNLPTCIKKVLSLSNRDSLSSSFADVVFALMGESDIITVDVETLDFTLLYKHSVSIVDFSVSEDPSLFVIVDDQQASTVVSIETRSVQQKKSHDHPVLTVAVALANNLCASGLKAKRAQMGEITFYCGPIELWNISNGEQVAMLEGHEAGGISGLSFAKDCKFLVSVTYGWQGPKVWDCETFQCIMIMTSHSEPAVRAKTSKDCNHTAVSCDSMGSIKVWKIESSGRSGHQGTIRHLKSCSADGSLFVSAGADTSVRLFERDLHYNTKERYCVKGSKGTPISDSEGHVADTNRLAISSDSSTLVSSSDDKTVMVWEINHSARKLNKFARLHAGGWLECVAITSQGNLIAAGDNYGTVKIWHLEDGNWTEFDTFETVKDFVLPQEYRPKDILHVTGDNVGCINISFSLDNLILLVSRGDGMIGIYKKQAGRGHDKFSDVFLSSVVAHEISRDDGLVEVFAEILSDSKTILSVGDNHLRVWDIQKVQPEFITEYPLNGTGRRFICEADKVIISTWNGWVDIFHSPGKTAGSSSALHWCRSGLTPLAKMWHGSRVDGFILNERLPSILVYGDDEGNVGTWKIIDAS